VNRECRRAELAKLQQDRLTLEPKVLDLYSKQKKLGLQRDTLQHCLSELTADVAKLTEDRAVLKDSVVRAQEQLDQRTQEQVEKKAAAEETVLLSKVNPRVVLDVFMSNRLEHEFTLEEEESFKDATEVPDGSVFKDKLQALEAANGTKRHDDAENEIKEHAVLDIDGASGAIVKSLLSLQATQKADRKDSKELLADLHEKFSWQVVRTANLLAQKIRGSNKRVSKESETVSKESEKMRHREDTALAFAISLVGICTLNWSPARKMISQKVGKCRRDVKEVIKTLPGQQLDIQRLKTHLNQVFVRWGPLVQTKQESEQWSQDVTVLEELLEGLVQQSQVASKVGSLKSLIDISKRCYNAWEALEEHFALQRKFVMGLRRRSTRPQDLRALLLASLADPDTAGQASLLRELAALVASTTAGRKAEATDRSSKHQQSTDRSVKRRRTLTPADSVT